MVNLACLSNDFDFVVIAMVVVDKQGHQLVEKGKSAKRSVMRWTGDRRKTYKSAKERDDVDDCERPARLEHRTILTEVRSPATAALFAIQPKHAQIAIDARILKVGAIRIGDPAEDDDCGD